MDKCFYVGKFKCKVFKDMMFIIGIISLIIVFGEENDYS